MKLILRIGLILMLAACGKAAWKEGDPSIVCGVGGHYDHGVWVNEPCSGSALPKSDKPAPSGPACGGWPLSPCD